MLQNKSVSEAGRSLRLTEDFTVYNKHDALLVIACIIYIES